MIRLLIASIAFVFLAESGVAQAQGLFGSNRNEYREADSYIDQYGREVIYDVQTGQVIAIVPRGERRYVTPSERRAARRRELGRDGEFRSERQTLGERLRRELEVHLGLREPSDGTFEGREREPDFARPQEPFPERPRVPGVAPRDRVERMPLGEPGEEPVDEFESGDGQIAALPGEELEDATPPPSVEPGVDPSLTGRGASDDVARIQVLLDRVGLSPGVIDGRMGDNVNKAISAYKEKTGQALRTYDPDSIKEALADTGGDAFTDYTITAVDAAGPFVASVPSDYGEKAKLDKLPYMSVSEMLAERFHMDERYLKAINPGANFNRPGTVIKVANAGTPLAGSVSRIVADKSRKQVLAYDDNGRLLAAYPATIGSGDTPSPSGTVTVERIAFDPEYTYNPDVNFRQGENHSVLTIPPGPNGPVGSIWIALSKPTYGIHGTPEPSKIGKTFSHGCVRLTNWDATELAELVTEGVTVEFVE